MYIGCNSDQINRALTLRSDIFLVITSSDISHNSNLKVSIIITHNCTDILIITELPLTELVHIKQFLVSLVAEFHIIHTGLDIG